MNASSIAIIVLATSLDTIKKETRYSYFGRDTAMKRTWGKDFSVQFAFGTNMFDWEFLEAKCNRTRRRLKARTKQTESRDAVDTFYCPGAQNQEIPVLFFANCTGEYYGIGPVCRCQEALRFWLQNDFQREWYIFMDDDMYFRSYALVSLLDSFNSSKPMAFVGARGLRGFALTHERWDRCGALCALRFAWAQPAIISRGALKVMKPYIDASFMTRAQTTWFGTHDVLLGFALWWTSIPLLSIGDLRLSRGPSSINRDFGLEQHAVRGQGIGSTEISADTLFYKLGDNTSASIPVQRAVGLRARNHLFFFQNDGARHILSPYSPDNLTYFPPELCNNKSLNPTDLLDDSADRRGPDVCQFVPFDYATSPLRNLNAASDSIYNTTSQLPFPSLQQQQQQKLAPITRTIQRPNQRHHHHPPLQRKQPPIDGGSRPVHRRDHHLQKPLRTRHIATQPAPR